MGLRGIASSRPSLSFLSVDFSSQIKMNIKDQAGDGKLDKSGKDFVYDITTATQTAK